MKPPAFWFNPPHRPGWQAQLLKPLGALYAQATRARLAKTKGEPGPVPIICIGNLNAGGTGKTPTAIALAQRLTAMGHAPHFLSRGYGGTLTGPIRIDPSRHTAAASGDEPLLLAAFAPAWVSRDRVAGAHAAAQAGASVILLDDGFQDPALRKDLSILVVDAAVGFGNGLCIPAGPLREPVRAGIARADLVIGIGTPDERAAFASQWPLPLAVVGAALQPLVTGMPWQGMRVLAFAGIGRPAKFFDTLRATGAHVVGAQALDDHQPLTTALMTRLQREAQALAAQLVTTEKDAVRLPAAMQGTVLTLPVRLVPETWQPIDAAMARVLPARA